PAVDADEPLRELYRIVIAVRHGPLGRAVAATRVRRGTGGPRRAREGDRRARPGRARPTGRGAAAPGWGAGPAGPLVAAAPPGRGPRRRCRRRARAGWGGPRSWSGRRRGGRGYGSASGLPFRERHGPRPGPPSAGNKNPRHAGDAPRTSRSFGPPRGVGR